MKTKELFFVFFLFFVFVSFFNCYDLICKWWSQHVRVVGTLGIEGWMKSVSILTFFVFFSKWMDYTITPTSSLFPVPIIVPEWDLTCSTSPSYRLVSGFIQLYLYWLLAVIYSQGVLSHVDCTWTTSPRLFPGDRRYVRWYCFSSFPSGCDQISHPQPLTVASILLLRIKTPLRPF